MGRHKKTSQGMFALLEEYLAYEGSIKGRSERSLEGLRGDLEMLLRFMLRRWERIDPQIPFDNISLNEFTPQDLKRIELADLYAFVNWLATSRKNCARTRARKISSIRSFFKFLDLKIHAINVNPALNLELPKKVRSQPRHLSLKKSMELLDTISDTNSKFATRDYCIVTLFLNCGMRLSELCGINLSDIKEDTIRLLGKGNKERTAYMNQATLDAISSYLPWRNQTLLLNRKTTPALFLSRRGDRLGQRMIQYMIKDYMLKSGIDISIYSTHKLRHTAATLMYQHGNVDIRSLQAILGHASIATTEIYTHINEKKLHDAVESNPLAHYKADKKPPRR